MKSSMPHSLLDLYGDEVIRNPYPYYKELRDQGSVVFLESNKLYAISRYADVRRSLREFEVFASGEGVGANDFINSNMRGPAVTCDPPRHETVRAILIAPLTPPALAQFKEQFQAAADELVERLLAQGSFDGVADFAQFLPVSIVSNLIGLPEEGRQNMLTWSAAGFDALGVLNARAQASLPLAAEAFAFMRDQVGRDRLKPGGWAARVYEAADRGEVAHADVPGMLLDYLGPSLDTTIAVTANLLRLLGQNPDQWELMRREPALIMGAINEAVRLETPIRHFTRYVKADHDVDGTIISAGSRALIIYASANRDERKWEEPERFDIRRKNADHVGFGHGRHQCAGQHLAKLEMQTLMTALVKRVTRIEVGEPVIAMNNTIRALERIPVRFL